jgi:phospholipid/cholesterol/gamma-HCH transport system substrate-binding protein
VAPPLVKGRALLKQRLGGIAFLVVIGLLVSLSVAFYNKSFTRTVDVSLRTDRVGNQLTVHADVKVRGVIVGEVRKISSSDGAATLKLALKPDKVHDLPKNLSAQLLPKTLFGEKEVNLVLPEDPQGELADGDVIEQDRSTTALETEKALDNLLPLLRSLRPQEISQTLNALSTALRGRGDMLGRNLAAQAAYLRSINPTLPTLAQDMAGLAAVSNDYADTTPDLLRTLDNLSASSRSLVEERAALDTFLKSTDDFAGRARSLVADNAQRFTDLAKDSIPSLQLYAKYSPGYPCLLRTIVVSQTETERTEGGPQAGLVITVEPISDRNGGYGPTEVPQYKEVRDNQCFGLNGKPVIPYPLYANPQDGYRDSDPPEQPGQGPGGCCQNKQPAYVAQYGSAPVRIRRTLPGVMSPFLAMLIAPVTGSHL